MFKAAGLGVVLALAVAGCTEVQVGSHIFKKAMNEYGCKEEGDLKVGTPYRVDGVRYEPMVSSLGYREQGVASWYGKDFHGKATANGECYNMYAYTAAHKTLPLPSLVRVTNMENNRSIVLKVNDRGPFVRGRVIDLSYAAAQSLDMTGNGTAPVLVEAIGGPHHYAGGARGNTQLAAALPNYGRKTEPAPKPLPTLPSYVPETTAVEELPAGPTVLDDPQSEVTTPMPASEVAKLEQQMPPPAEVADLPPPPEGTPESSVAPLINTNAYVQVGAFGSVANAERLLDRLRTVEQEASLSKVDSNGVTLTRVRSGPYATLAEAEAALGRLVDAGFAGAMIAIEHR